MKSNIRALNKKDKKAYLYNKKFPVIVFEKNGLFLTCIKELGLTSKGSSLSDSYAELIEKKRQYIDHVVNMDFEDIIEGTKIIIPKFNPWLLFTVKCLIFVIIFVGSMMIGLHSFADKMAFQVDRIDHRLEQTLNPPEEKSQERLDRFKIKLEQLKPYVKAVKEMLTD